MLKPAKKIKKNISDNNLILIMLFLKKSLNYSGIISPPPANAPDAINSIALSEKKDPINSLSVLHKKLLLKK
jgi:hypothetical protein